jgi:predicted nucleotidyltransferase
MVNPVTLLQQRDLARHKRRLEVYAETRLRLRVALADLIPGTKVILFGSLTKPGVFNDRSDVDLALMERPAQLEVSGLLTGLMERLHRPVDLVMLDDCRFRLKILREGEPWIA